MTDNISEEKDATSIQELIEQLKPLAELTKLQRDISVNRLERMSADMQMAKLKNPGKSEKKNGDKSNSK